MENYIKSFCDEFEYPFEAQQAFINGYQKIKENSKAYDLFEQYLTLYQKDQLKDYTPVFPTLEEVSNVSGVHTYTVQLLFFVCLSKHLRELYKRKEIAYDVFYASMCDLKWKLKECYDMYGVWGSFVAFWFPGFFELNRFALGRLQFELYHINEFEEIKINHTYVKDGFEVKPEDIVLNVHIPSCGPLNHEDCLASYQMAAEFFKAYFDGRPTVFVCESWLLNPDHPRFLPKKSNILGFARDYDIIDSFVDQSGYDMWRLFHKEYHNNPEEMPCNSSLQRAYVEWLKAGNDVKCGFGVFVYDKECQTE